MGGGRKSFTWDHEEHLRQMVIDWDRDGIPLSMVMLSVYIRLNFRCFHNKTNNSVQKWCYRFCKRHGLSGRMVQHKGDSNQVELEEKKPIP